MISIIAAVSDNNVIGNNNSIPWKMPADMKFFKNTTSGHVVVMGRKTFESFGARPLPNRLNVVVTKNGINRSVVDPSVLVMRQFDKDLFEMQQVKEGANGEIFIIGGAEIYKMGIGLANKMYITRIHATVEGDTYFPEIGPDWVEVSREEYKADEKNQYDYTIIKYEK